MDYFLLMPLVPLEVPLAVVVLALVVPLVVPLVVLALQEVQLQQLMVLQLLFLDEEYFD